MPNEVMFPLLSLVALCVLWGMVRLFRTLPIVLWETQVITIPVAPKPTMTDWYPPEIKPVRVGVWEVGSTHVGIRFFSYWTGCSWGASGGTPESAYSARYLVAVFQEMSWRGFTEEQK